MAIFFKDVIYGLYPLLKFYFSNYQLSDLKAKTKSGSEKYLEDKN
jgi:hypothetical protein